ncbi:MAG: putative RND superfamily exporter protein [Myxococcota bacterium]|jgi:predicted RND superfamily exporter protein
MRRRIFEKLANVIARHPAVVGAFVLILTVLSIVWLATDHLSLDSSRHAIVNADDPEQMRLMAYNERFGTNDLIMVLEGDDTVALRRTADAVAQALAPEPEIDDIFYRLTTSDVAQAGLWYLPVAELERVKRGLDSMQALFDDDGDTQPPAPVNGLTEALIELNKGLESFAEEKGAGLKDPKLSEKDLTDLTDAAVGIFDDLRGWIGDPSRESVGMSLSDTDANSSGSRSQGFGLDDAGYLAVGDAGNMLLLRITGKGDMIDHAYTRPLIESVRERTNGLIAEGITLGLTGLPAIVVDEDDTIRRDMPLTSTVSIIGCMLLFLLAYRSLRGAAVVFLPLMLGILWCVAVSTVLVDSLTTFTGTFLVINIGLGIDFGVHLFTRIALERRDGRDPDEATRNALIGTGPPILVGGMTSAVAFGVMMFTEFRGTRELGTVASTGLVLVLLATFVVMPLVVRRIPSKGPNSGARFGGGLPWGLPKSLAWPAIIGGGIVTIILAAMIRPVEFDIDVNDFLPQDVESIRTLRSLEATAKSGVEFAGMTAVSIEEAQEQAKQARALPADLVSRVESAADFFPPDLAAKIPLVSALRKDAGRLADIQFNRGKADGKAFIEALDETVFLLRNDVKFTLDTALQRKDLGLRVERLGLAAEKLLVASKAMDDAALAARVVEYETELSTIITGLTRMLKAADRPFHITDLPQSLIGSFYATDGSAEHFGTRVYPGGDIFDPTWVRVFHSSLKEIDPGTTGYAVVYSHFAVLFAQGLTHSVLWASLCVLLLVWFDMRSIRDSLLALCPLLIGATWMVGFMEVFSISWTFANGVSMALIIGIGVDSGVHLVHRWRENNGDVVDAVKTSGKAIAVSSLTTMIAFGSMSLGRYEGLRGLGLVLLLGVGSCLFATLFILPGILHLISKGDPTPTDG